jgi:3-oxoacyl-[acyl-carrier-protein] synthase II
MNVKRVVVTGMEVVTPLGVGLKDCWNNLKNGVSGIKKISFFDPKNHKCQIAGECRDFKAEDFLDPKFIRRYDRMFHLFVSVALLTAENWNFKKDLVKNPFRFSVIGASALGAPSTFEEIILQYLNFGPKKVSPMAVINLSANTAAGEVARIFNAKGPQYFLQEACSAGTKALGLAYELIKNDVIDIAFVIGADSGIRPAVMASLENLGAIVDAKWNEIPEKASRPFDKLRSGFVPSEGSGCVILESLENALDNGRTPLVEIIGFGATCDAYHPTAPEPSAQSIIKCIKMALKSAQIKPETIDYINAHGTGTLLNDVAETKAIKEVFGEYAYKIPISANKSMIGHTWGAAGTIETIFSIKTILEETIPPTINLEYPDPECDLYYVPQKAIKKKVKTVLKNSFGFGGINACLILKAWEGGEK